MSSYEDVLVHGRRRKGIEVEIRIGDWTKLGSVLRDARKERGLSQHDLAHRAGVSRSWLARLETGHRGAELEPLFRLLNALDLSLSLRDERSHEVQQENTTWPSALANHQRSVAARRRAWKAASTNPGSGRLGHG